MFGAPNMRRMDIDVVRLIDALGGTNATARATGVKPPSVSEWRKSGIFPADKLVLVACRLEERQVATRFELFPNTWHRIWPDLIGTEGAPEVPTTQAQEARDAA